MAKYTKQDIIAMVEEEDVEFIRMQFTDIEAVSYTHLRAHETG